MAREGDVAEGESDSAARLGAVTAQKRGNASSEGRAFP
jgi:hypothetical protein